jgi:hypothetical protein
MLGAAVWWANGAVEARRPLAGRSQAAHTRLGAAQATHCGGATHVANGCAGAGGQLVKSECAWAPAAFARLSRSGR